MNYKNQILTVLDDGTIITVECHTANSLPDITIVGFTNRAVTEARERIRAALSNSNIRLPRKRIIINLAPADIPKQGSSFDFAILLSILSRTNTAIVNVPDHTVVIGEIGLDGSIRPIRGIIGKILAAQRAGIKNVWVPSANLAQAELIPNIKAYGFTSVEQLLSLMKTGRTPEQHQTTQRKAPNEGMCLNPFKGIAGQERAKRALLIAAAGRHNCMLIGPPGTGKSLLARSLVNLMPAPTTTEILESTHIYSLSSTNFDRVLNERQVRAPHHNAPTQFIVGGGRYGKPGEISLAHNGVLIFDEFPEFSRQTLEALRQPIESHSITTPTINQSIELPADFVFVGTANPCPAGLWAQQLLRVSVKQAITDGISASSQGLFWIESIYL